MCWMCGFRGGPECFLLTSCLNLLGIEFLFELDSGTAGADIPSIILLSLNGW